MYLLPIQAGKLKGMGKLGQWSNNIVNHFWFCSRTCNTSLDSLKVNIFMYIESVYKFQSRPNGLVCCIMCQITMNG